MRLVIALSTACALLASGCFLDHGVPPDVPPPPLLEIDVDAAISGVTLGEDCPSGGADGDLDCAPGGPCPALCQQSNVQLAILTGEGEGGPLTWQVMRVTLHDFETGELLQELGFRDPRVWVEGDGYREWDELLPAPSDLSTTYDLTAPDWNDIGTRFGDFWSRGYEIRMHVEVEGEERTLISTAVYRVADIDT